jgi:hypothetical protein
MGRLHGDFTSCSVDIVVLSVACERSETCIIRFILQYMMNLKENFL